MQAAVIARIRSEAPGMTPALSRVAQHVLVHAPSVLYQSITELAEEAQSSEASVMRFCRELGFSGFQKFKLALAQELAAHSQVVAPPASSDPVRALMETAKTALNETERLMDYATLEAVVDGIASATHIEIFGVAASAVTAQYLEYKLTRLGLRARAGADAHVAMMIAETSDDSVLHILVSSSGSTIDTVRVAELARKRGARTLAITSRAKSPLTAVSDDVLLASWPETPFTGGAFPSKISQLLIIDALVVHLIGADPRRFEAIKNTARSVSDRNF